MQHSVTSDAPVSSSRCGYRARVSLQAAWIFVSFVLLPLPVSVACVCRCCGNCAVLLAARPAAPQPPSVGFFFSPCVSRTRSAASCSFCCQVNISVTLTAASIPSCVLACTFPRLSRTSWKQTPRSRLPLLLPLLVMMMMMMMRVSCVLCVRNSQTAPLRGAVRGRFTTSVRLWVCVFRVGCDFSSFLQSGFNRNFLFFILSRHQFGSRVRWQRKVGR